MASSVFRETIMDIESKLCQIKGVRDAKVVVSDDEDIQEIHLIAAPNDNPAGLVREIESKLLLECSLPIDKEKVTIVELDKRDANDGSRTKQPRVRLKLVDVQITRSSVNASATVMLQVNDVTLCGEAGGPASKNNMSRLVAEASIGALKRVIRSSYAISIDDLKIIDLGGDSVAVVKLSQVNDGGELYLTGSAIVDRGIEPAIAKAVLDAVNRQLHDFRFV